MPRPDNKRQKRGRPSDPRASVFQEQFLPQMPGSTQRNVFIQPTPQIVDAPSKISFGNMVPGPDSGLQTLAALAKGVTQEHKLLNKFINIESIKAKEILTK